MSPQETEQSTVPIDTENSSIVSPKTTKDQLFLEALEWSETEIQESYYRLKHFEEDWNAPGMGAYDDL